MCTSTAKQSWKNWLEETDFVLEESFASDGEGWRLGFVSAVEKKGMRPYTTQILSKLINYIDLYLESKITLRELVEHLEHSLNALEEKLPEAFYPNWNEHWGNLEIELAMSHSQGKVPDYERAAKNAIPLKHHIQSFLDDTPTRG